MNLVPHGVSTSVHGVCWNMYSSLVVVVKKNERYVFVNGVARARSSVLWHTLFIKEILVLQL